MKCSRRAFNPCVFHGLVYLSGNCGVMEVFSPGQDLILPLAFPLPENTAYCVYEDKDLLVLHSWDYIVKFAAGPNGQLQQLSQQLVVGVNKGQNSQPVVDRTRGMVCYIQNGKCMQVEMETGREVGRIQS